MKLNPFFRCACGKIHTRTFLSPNSKCSCGRGLWTQVWK